MTFREYTLTFIAWLSLLAMLLTFMFFGCAHVQDGFYENTTNVRQCTLPVAVVTDNRITEPFRQASRNAMKYWNDFSGQELFMSLGAMSKEAIDKHPKWFAIITPISEEDWPSTCRNSCGTISFNFRVDTGCMSSVVIKVAERCMAHENQTVAFESMLRHELGHILGLPEADDKAQTVMNPRGWFGQLPATANEDDLKLLQELYR